MILISFLENYKTAYALKRLDYISSIFDDDALIITGRVLKNVKIHGSCTTGFYDRIVTLREFLEKFSEYDVNFAIELKGADVETETLEMVKAFGIMNKTTFTSFNFQYIEKIKKLDKTARVGWLVSTIDDDIIKQLLEIGGEEIAPKAESLSKEIVEKLRNVGLGIRAWGVFSIALMKKMCALGVDGMTVNFPDRLYEYLHTL